MAFPKSKRKNYTVDGLKYTACINECGYTSDGAMKLNVAILAEYGKKSLCIVEGMANREYWADYPDFDAHQTFAITPRVICEIIRYAHRSGWSPQTDKSNKRIKLDNDGLRELISTVV